jgi:hypothetical protein
MYKSLLVFSLISVIAFACNTDDVEPSAANVEYELYSTFLDSDFFQDEVAVVEAESFGNLSSFNIREYYLDYVRQEYPEIEANLLQNLAVVANDSLLFEASKFRTNKQVVIINRDELLSIFSDANGTSPQEMWNNFQLQYGETAARVALSRVSFNGAADEALFGVAVGRGAYYGYVVHLKKVEGKWVIADVINHWVT